MTSSSTSNMVNENNKTNNSSSITIINNNNNTCNTNSTISENHDFQFNKNNAKAHADHQSNYKKNGIDENFLLLQLSMCRTNIGEAENAVQNQQTFDENCLTAAEEESFICPQCFRTYRRHGTLRRHLRQECGKGKSMVCSVCGHRTKRADHLRQHVRKKHPDVAMRSLFRRVSFEPTTSANTIPISLYSTTSTVVTSSSESRTIHTQNILHQQLEKTLSNTNATDDVSNIITLDDDSIVDNESSKSAIESGNIEHNNKNAFRSALMQHLQQVEQKSNASCVSPDNILYNIDIALNQNKCHTHNFQ